MPAYAVMKTLEVLVKSGVIHEIGYNPKTGQKTFRNGG
jgi:hypothetical protein